MASGVPDVRLRVVPRPSSPPAPKNYTLMEVNGVTFLLTDMKGGKELEHTPEEWELKAKAMTELFKQLETDNDGDFSPEFISHVSVETAQNRVTYNKRSDQLGTPIVAKIKNPQILKSLGCNPYVPFTHSGLKATHKGSFNQYKSPTATNNPDAGSACSYIVAEFAEQAVIAWESDQDTPINIDHTIEIGQKKYLAAGLAARQHVNVAEIDLEKDFKKLKKGSGATLDIPASETADYFKRELDKLCEEENLSIAALTIRGETMGLIIARDPKTHAIKQLIYFDSHGNQANDADGKACLKYFDTVDAAAAFLAHRIPYQPISSNPDWNKLSLTPLIPASG